MKQKIPVQDLVKDRVQNSMFFILNQKNSRVCRHEEKGANNSNFAAKRYSLISVAQTLECLDATNDEQSGCFGRAISWPEIKLMAEQR